MRAFLLGMSGCVLLACGGNVVVDGSGGAATTGAGGAGGASCAGLVSAFEAAFTAAIACDPSAPADVCTAEISTECGCPALANGTGSLAADAEAARHAMQAAGCVPATGCSAGCTSVSVMFAQCLPTTAGHACGEGPG